MASSEVCRDEEECQRHLSRFIEKFLKPEVAERWKSLFAMKSTAWARVPVAGFPLLCKTEFCHNIIGLRDQSISDEYLSKLGDPRVILIRAGHDPNLGFAVGSLRQALVDSQLIREGIISIDAGHLAIVVNHEDEDYLCFDNAGKFAKMVNVIN